MIDPLRLEAPAKVNLTLRVTGRRPDGYHELESDFVLLELADRLLLMPGCSGFRLDGRHATDLPLDERNLAVRGLRAALGGEPELACLALEKAIPAAAGLGGGSSDAAAAWRLGRASRGIADTASASDIEELAAIGADIPFFAARVAAARVTGIGERVEPMSAVAAEVVLVHPGFGLATASVFAELRESDWGTRPNDLLGPALRLRPELSDVIDRVRVAGGDPRLTGSGPTIFSITDDPERADALAGRLHDDGLAVTRTRTRSTAATIETIHQEE